MTVITDEVVCAPRSGTLYDVLDLILDRGIVIDAFVRVSLVGIEILKIDARIVVASVDTYLRFAEVCNRLDLEHDASSRTVPELFGGAGTGPGAAKKLGAKKAARSVGKKVKETLGVEGGDGDDDEDEDDGKRSSQRRSPARAASSRARSGRRSEED